MSSGYIVPCANFAPDTILSDMNDNQEKAATAKLINDFFQTIASKDLVALADFCAEDIDWYIFQSPDMPWTGRRTKKADIPAVFKQIMACHVDGEEKFVVDHVFIEPNEAAVFGTAGRRVKSTGKWFEAIFCMRFTIANGLITKFTMLEDSHQIEAAHH